MSATAPDDESVVTALLAVRAKDSKLGIPKIHSLLKSQNNWQLSLDRLKKIAQLHNLVNTSQLYLIRQTDAKGLGAFATRNIQPGTIVISEPPIVVTNDESVNVAFESLNEAQKSLFMSFTRSPSSSNRGKATLSAAELVFQNNAYAWDPSNVQGLAAMFATLPRFNHHCSPNLTYQSDFENGRGTFVAIKPIATGEELCTSYCERTEPRSIRRARLQETYGFHCRCSTCTMPEAEQRESDNLRLSCRLLDEHAGKGMPKLERLRVLHLRLNLLAKEGLLGPDRARSLWDATQVCMHSMSSIGEDQDPETMEEKAETLQMYAACCSLEFARGGNVAESKRLAVMAGGRARTGANEEMWSTLDDLKKLRYVSEEERIAWEEHLLAELGVAMRLGRSDK